MDNVINNENIKQYLKKEKNVGGQEAFDLDIYKTQNIKIRKNNMVSPGNFKEDPLIPGGYLAHEQTILAIRKDLFVAGADPDILLMPFVCCCGAKLDLQFWEKCPHCSRSIELRSRKMSD